MKRITVRDKTDLNKIYAFHTRCNVFKLQAIKRVYAFVCLNRSFDYYYADGDVDYTLIDAIHNQNVFEFDDIIEFSEWLITIKDKLQEG